ncbi:ras guanine nucleotide exchange factor glfB-like [Dysidea avara]|uniref:ras guanine nucleotide exchange factor glfB-like n=1 Tax=Dysidea avara TaxID=196820 RepID=UPI00332381C5
MADNPGKVVTRFQFSSLFNKAWFLSIQPHTIVSGFRKVGVYPFNSTAIKPYDNSSISNKIPEATPVMMPAVTQPNERSSVSQDGFSEHNLEESGPGLSPVSYSEEQIELFQRRYDNGYNIYDDQMYVSWLQQQHPDDLPENFSSSTTIETQVNGEQVEPLNCNTSTEDDSTVDKENVVPSPEQPMDSTVDKENVVPSPEQPMDSTVDKENAVPSPEQPMDSTVDKENAVPSPEQPMDSTVDKENVEPSPEQPTYSLSASLANTRVFVSELREILGERRVVSKASTKSKSTARVLTSAESLTLLIEKEKKKKEEEEQKAKRKEERDRKRQEKEEEKKS